MNTGDFVSDNKLRTVDMKLDAEYVDFFKEPSTNEIELRQQVIKLWTDLKVIKFTDQTFVTSCMAICNDIYKQIDIPDSDKKQMISAASFIGDQLVSLYNDDLVCGKYIVWTLEGTIDKVLTYNYMISDIKYDLLIKLAMNPDNEYLIKYFTKLFVIACRYCLVKHIHDLWKGCPPVLLNKIHNHYNGNNVTLDCDNYIVSYWLCALTNQTSKYLINLKKTFTGDFNNLNDDIINNIFLLSVIYLDFEVIKYFWSNLSDQKKNDYIFKCIDDMVYCSERRYLFEKKMSFINIYSNDDEMEIFFFFLSQLNNEALKFIFEKYSKNMLMGMCKMWSQQSKFFSMIKNIIKNIDVKNVYSPLVKLMLNLLKSDEKLYKDMLKELWEITPIDIRYSFLEEHKDVDIKNVSNSIPILTMINHELDLIDEQNELIDEFDC